PVLLPLRVPLDVEVQEREDHEQEPHGFRVHLVRVGGPAQQGRVHEVGIELVAGATDDVESSVAFTDGLSKLTDGEFDNLGNVSLHLADLTSWADHPPSREP